MGKGVIVEHLGDAHYRIGLDIDVSYARDQLTAINLYLDEFAPKYAEATQAKDDAQAALTPINDRLTVYLADAQSASQAAYDAMVAAYDEWIYAVEHQPDPGDADFLLDALTDAKAEFDAAHDQYIMALDGDPQAELTPEEALTARTDALSVLTVAMSDFQNGVGPLLDETEVNDALDLLGVALSDFENATVAYTADPGNPTLKSAMNYYRGVYDSAHSDWVSTVNANSGDALVQAKRDAYDTAAEAFDTARENLGSLLGNGGMPAELASIMADQERAWATYHGALQTWQSLTLIKVEKESAKAELMSRLLPYTDPNGDPIRQTVNAWCCDLTEDMTVGAEVATIEIPGERDQAVRVRPGYESRETYRAARDGLLQPSWASSPEATCWNWALHPGNARWNPNYRLGEILFVDQDANTCTVQLDPQRNNEKSRARDGNTLDVINPVKYAIDPTTGAQTSSTPGDNVMVDAGVTTLTDVPIEYMECNAAVFEVGDHVMVEFQNRDWTQPKVIGFAENPKPCSVRGVIFTASGVDSWARIKEGQQSFSHPLTPIAGGNYDWTSTDKKRRLTWRGPPGRSIRNRIEPFSATTAIPALSTTHGSIRSLQYLNADYTGATFVCIDDHDRYIWQNGAIWAEAPSGHVVIGAGIHKFEAIDESGASIVINYLIVATRPSISSGNLLGNTSAHTISFHWAKITGNTVVNASDLNQFHSIDFNAYDALPMLGCVHFSGSSSECSGCVPRRVEYAHGIYASPDAAIPSYGVGNDVIFTLQLMADEDGMTVGSETITAQDHTPAEVNITQVTDITDTGGSGIVYVGTHNANFRRYQSDAAIVAVDYVGDEKVTLTVSYLRDHSASTAWQLYDDKSNIGTASDYYSVDATADDIVQISLTDSYRSRVITVLDSSAAYSGSQSGLPGHGPGASSASDNISSLRPIFYDLRTGAYIAENAEVTTTITNYQSTHIEITKSIVGPDLTPHWTTTRNVSSSYGDGSSVIDVSTPFPGITMQNPIGQEAGSSACNALAMPWAAQWTIRSGSVDGETYVDRYARWSSFTSPAWELAYMPETLDWQTRRNFYEYGTYITKKFTTLPIFCQQITGADSVARITSLDLTPDVSGLVFQFASKDNINTVFATGFDIDAAWQSHLDAQHPPAEGEEQITQTALEADLKPVFKV